MWRWRGTENQVRQQSETKDARKRPCAERRATKRAAYLPYIHTDVVKLNKLNETVTINGNNWYKKCQVGACVTAGKHLVLGRVKKKRKSLKSCRCCCMDVTMRKAAACIKNDINNSNTENKQKCCSRNSA